MDTIIIPGVIFEQNKIIFIHNVLSRGRDEFIGNPARWEEDYPVHHTRNNIIRQVRSLITNYNYHTHDVKVNVGSFVIRVEITFTNEDLLVIKLKNNAAEIRDKISAIVADAEKSDYRWKYI